MIVHVSGKLSKDDYEHFAPEAERLIAQHGKINILLEMHDFHGWDFSGLWADTQFAWHHFSGIGRLAMVGEKRWHKSMATFCKPFTKAEVRYFEHPQMTEAENWVQVVTAPV